MHLIYLLRNCGQRLPCILLILVYDLHQHSLKEGTLLLLTLHIDYPLILHYSAPAFGQLQQVEQDEATTCADICRDTPASPQDHEVA